jgi:hypothetical protein
MSCIQRTTTLTFQPEASNMTWDASTPKTFDRVAKYGVSDCQIATIPDIIPPPRNSFDHGMKYQVRDYPVETITAPDTHDTIPKS